jgi:2-keto-4-pentenoate hydratase
LGRIWRIRSAPDWTSNLAGFEIDLLRDGAVVDRGHSANVLDGPLSALHHLVGLLASDPIHSTLATGDVVTTGTLTRAFPIFAGESWKRRFTASSSAAGLFGSREPEVASSAGRSDREAGTAAPSGDAFRP